VGTYRNISLTFWTDAKIDDDFTPHEKYLYLYFLTNPHTTICGCYQISQKQMTMETGLEWAEVEQLITRMQDVHKVLRYCPETKEILLVNWGKYNWSRSYKVQAAVYSVAKHIENPEFQAFVISAIDAKMNVLQEDCHESGEKERSKEKAVSQNCSIAVSQNRSIADSATDAPIEYEYPIDTVSDADSLVCGAVVDDDFKLFWDAYPRKIREVDARAAFETVDVPVSVLLEAIASQKRGTEWQKENGRFIPSPANWLKDRRWTDGVTPSEDNGKAKPCRKGAVPF
jgi:hypothetical protein